MEYSKQQKEAINHLNGPALVLAVPGSGKTTVLLQRVYKLISQGIDPKSLLIMTFSKSQAIDMQIKFRKKYSINDVSFSTIHSFAYSIVRWKYKLDKKEISIIEASDKFNKYKIIEGIYASVNKSRISEDDLEEFFRVSGYIKNTLLSYDDYRRLYGKSIKNFETIYEKYNLFKYQHDLIDFDDMLVMALRILQSSPDILKSLQNRFKYVQIDEGQDTSLVQFKIISLIAQPENNLFIVADDDQSIYGFRGAEARQLLNFNKTYPQAKIYLMEDNYRSTKYIVEMSKKLIANNKIRYDKNLISANEIGDNIEIIKAKTSTIQAKYVLKEAKKLVNKNQTVAILYRNNLSALNLLNLLEEDDDFYIKDSKINFYSHFILNDLINILNFAKDPFDINIFERIYYKLNMYLKKDFIDQIKLMDPQLSILDRLEVCDGFNSFYIEKLDLLRYYLEKIRRGPLSKSVSLVFRDLGYGDYLEEQARRLKTPIITYKRIIDSILNLSLGLKDLYQLEQKIKKMRNLQKNHSSQLSKLTLSTIHGSKGLEYDNVFLIDLIEDEFPSAFSLKADSSDGMLEEERRLFYVGMTRAKKKLKLITIKNLFDIKAKPSMFLDEIIKKPL
ncbi:MAG: ATP-dependent helicase [Tissierellia bacterium]|nr:ATP-dependent helicase [Tissierellia bacterium]